VEPFLWAFDCDCQPNLDEAVVFEEFFTAGLRMPLHPVLADILQKFQV
jgi:tRNA A37 threonylcarbamoyladenosine synthetase subunit TsaC/SUA5/YrdC